MGVRWRLSGGVHQSSTEVLKLAKSGLIEPCISLRSFEASISLGKPGRFSKYLSDFQLSRIVQASLRKYTVAITALLTASMRQPVSMG